MVYRSSCTESQSKSTTVLITQDTHENTRYHGRSRRGRRFLLLVAARRTSPSMEISERYFCFAIRDNLVQSQRRNFVRPHPSPMSFSARNQATTMYHSNGSSSSSKKKRIKTPPWFEAIESDQVEVLFLTGPSLSVDSRPLQLHWIQLLQNFFQSLIVNQQSPYAGFNLDNLFCVEALPPSQLDAEESSRVVLFGKLPAGTNDKIELACLSNLLDYISPDIRHGNSTMRTTKNNKSAATITASVHVVSGILCTHSKTLAWITAWNASVAKESENQPSGVVLPESLHNDDSLSLASRKTPQSAASQPQTIIPYVRRIRVNAKGKKTVETLSQGKESSQQKDHTKRSTGLPQPSREQILMEAQSCPFFFLPMYHS